MKEGLNHEQLLIPLFHGEHRDFCENPGYFSHTLISAFRHSMRDTSADLLKHIMIPYLIPAFVTIPHLVEELRWQIVQ